MSELFIVRHGRTAWNEEGRIIGHRDIGLSPAGENDIRSMAALLRPVRFDRILCSDLRRARQSASIIRELLRTAVPIEAVAASPAS